MVPTLQNQIPQGMATGPDINDPSLLNEVVTYDTSISGKDFFTIKLPDDGEHPVVIKLSDKGVTVDRQKNKTNPQIKDGTAYLMANVVCTMLDGAGQELPIKVYDNPTSIQMGSSMSRLHAILDVIGSKAPSGITLGELKAWVETAFAQPAYATITTQWQASYEESKGKYKTILRGQKKFPPATDTAGNPTGEYEQAAFDAASGKSVDAQVKILRYGPKQ